MSRPNRAIEPASAASSPVIRLNSVVLPAPLGPMMRRRSPGSTARSTPLVTRRPPNDFVNPLIASALTAALRTPICGPDGAPGSAAGDHHQQHLGRGLQRRYLGTDELLVVEVE